MSYWTRSRFLHENQQTVVHGGFPDFYRKILGLHKNSSLDCLQNMLIAIELGQKILFIRKAMTQFYVYGSIVRESGCETNKSEINFQKKKKGSLA